MKTEKREKFISPSYSDMIVFVTFIIILVVRQVMILRRR